MNNWQYNTQFVSAMRALETGGVIAYPTEAVWGLGCDPLDALAIEELLCLKSRPVEKGVILVGGCMSDFDFLLHDLAPKLYKTLELSWPGHNTWLVPHKNRVSPLVHGAHDTVAIRVSTHPLIKAITETFGGPIVSTSANPAGKPPAKSSIKARNYFLKSGISFMPGSIADKQRASIIRHLISGKVVRA